MKYLTLTLSLILGLTSPVFATPLTGEILQHGTVIHKTVEEQWSTEYDTLYKNPVFYIVYEEVLYECAAVRPDYLVSCVSYQNGAVF